MTVRPYHFSIAGHHQDSLVLSRIIRPILKVFLLLLDKLYQAKRKSHTPLYPYDKSRNTISLPPEVRKEIGYLVMQGRKPEALKKVANITGASLRISKDYIDDLAEARAIPQHSSRKRRKR